MDTPACIRPARRQILALALGALALPMASAQDYPSRPVRIVVPFAAGGPADNYARFVAQRLQDALKQPFVVENRPGAGSVIGTDAVAKAAPDGYTLVMGQTSNMAINPSLYAKLPYNPQKDLTPVGLVASAPLVIAVASNYHTRHSRTS